MQRDGTLLASAGVQRTDPVKAARAAVSCVVHAVAFTHALLTGRRLVDVFVKLVRRLFLSNFVLQLRRIGILNIGKDGKRSAFLLLLQCYVLHPQANVFVLAHQVSAEVKTPSRLDPLLISNPLVLTLEAASRWSLTRFQVDWLVRGLARSRELDARLYEIALVALGPHGILRQVKDGGRPLLGFAFNHCFLSLRRRVIILRLLYIRML